MAMRSQVYEWDASRTDNGSAAMTSANSSAGVPYSVFIGGLGNNITTPANTTATQFVVIEDIGVTPTAFCGIITGTATNVRGLRVGATSDVVAGGRNYVNVRINTTDYFLNPDNVGNDGVPGSAAPYPRSIWFQPAFNLYPDVYVLPGQTWDIRVTYWNQLGGFTAGAATAGQYQAFCKYTLYDGPDALIANKLLEMGISVNPGNVDWYKRTLISGGNA